VFEVYRFDHVEEEVMRVPPSCAARDRGAAVDVGCRFFSGYPMLPFTGLLDVLTRAAHRGAAIQADTEIEGVNMTRGGHRGAATDPPGRRFMQEAIAEAALNGLLVVFTMGRAQDTSSARGRRLGDYRTITLAPSSGRGRRAPRGRASPTSGARPSSCTATMIGFTQMTVEHGARADCPAREAMGAQRQFGRHRDVEGDLDLADGEAQHARRRSRPALA
jgi:hypothetical protein